MLIFFQVDRWPYIRFFKKEHKNLWSEGDILHSILPSDVIKTLEVPDMVHKGSRFYYRKHKWDVRGENRPYSLCDKHVQLHGLIRAYAICYCSLGTLSGSQTALALSDDIVACGLIWANDSHKCHKVDIHATQLVYWVWAI